VYIKINVFEIKKKYNWYPKKLLGYLGYFGYLGYHFFRIKFYNFYIVGNSR